MIKLAPWDCDVSINEEAWSEYVVQLESLEDKHEVGLQLIEKAEQVLKSPQHVLSLDQTLLSQVLQLIGLLCRQMVSFLGTQFQQQMKN